MKTVILFLAVASGLWSAAPNVEFFEKNVRPVLVSRCYACHSADTKPAGGLRVDDRNGLLTGGNSGPAVIPGDPENSLLLARLRHEDPKRRMPKAGDPVSASELANLVQWIRDGVAWPSEVIPESLSKVNPAYAGLRARHWAWQPLTDPHPPVVHDTAWPAGDIDRFILAKLEENQLRPVADAGRTTLIRRVTYDLTGLPPSPEEIDAFLGDRSPNAYERLVDRLLASPRFGERWGRHWLDIARYAESSGPSRNIPYPHAWRYRDYVIDALNHDIPFDRFIEEQIAGDLLPARTATERDRLQIATGFLAIGPKDTNQRFKERFLMDNVDEKIDTVTRSVLALTVSCARCHDHKFDPIPTTDYYSLAGIFTSTEDATGFVNKMGGSGLDYYRPELLVRLASYVPPPPSGKLEPLIAEVAAAKKEWERIRGTPEGLAIGPEGKPKQRPFRMRYERLELELLDLTDPGSFGGAVHGVREARLVGDTAVRIRGQAERLGPIVPRGFLTVFDVPRAKAANPVQSGRLELAQWLSSPWNPLTPRVAVNRIWHHLFGRGIVSTVDNFGITGDRPTHPALLDYLASRFVQDGWSVKRLIRTIALSRSYRLGAGFTKAYYQTDPENKFLWRHSPRRLDAEELRDSLLQAPGTLDLNPPHGSAAANLRMIEMADNGKESQRILRASAQSVARSIYLPLLRTLTPGSLEAFDPVTQTLVTGRRDATTVSTQSLFLLNSAFVQRQSLALARRLLADSHLGTDTRIRLAYKLTMNRKPIPPEVEQAWEFLTSYELAFANEAPPAASKSGGQAKAPATLIAAGELTDDERTAAPAVDSAARPESPHVAAWMAFAQSLFASAEYRFVR